MQKILKDRRGSISLFVLLSALFFLVIVTGVAVSLKNREASVDAQYQKVKASYEKDVGNEEGVYNEEITKTVSFDANGGTVNTPSKVVKLGETYGELPTPIREGYTFKGWNGKNLFDESKIITNSYINSDTGEESSNSSWVKSNFIECNPNTEYAFSYESEGTTYVQSKMIFYNENKEFIFGKYIEGYENTISAKSPVNARYLALTYSVKVNSNTVVRKNIRLEKGSDTTEYEPYYVTSNTIVTQNNDNRYVLTAIWEKKQAAFIDGSTFNYMIKELAGDDTSTLTYRHNYFGNNINYIKRAKSLPANLNITENNIVSTSDSKFPIYAWYDNGTIYYYTEALNPKVNYSASYMFRSLINVKEIDVSTFDTGNVANMNTMFFNCPSLVYLNLNNWDTGNVKDMTQMFDMYSDNNYLTELDLSSFNMSKVTNTTNMISKMPALQKLKTPKIYPSDSSVNITLPKTLYDSSNNAYTTLTSTSPTQTWLTSE